MPYAVRINKDLCVSAGKCVADAPDVFTFDDDELAEVVTATPSLSDEQLVRIARQCPGRAILLCDGDGTDVAF